jgi:hypothetical protein
MDRWLLAGVVVLALVAGELYRRVRGRRPLEQRVPYEYL